MNFVFLEFYCFVILGIRFSYALASGVLILLVFEGAMLVGFSLDWRIFAYFSYHVVTVFILAALIGWWREFVLRKDFSTQTTLQEAKDFLKDQNARLEAEVTKRTRTIRETQAATIW